MGLHRAGMPLPGPWLATGQASRQPAARDWPGSRSCTECPLCCRPAALPFPPLPSPPIFYLELSLSSHSQPPELPRRPPTIVSATPLTSRNEVLVVLEPPSNALYTREPRSCCLSTVAIRTATPHILDALQPVPRAYPVTISSCLRPYIYGAQQLHGSQALTGLVCLLLQAFSGSSASGCLAAWLPGTDREYRAATLNGWRAVQHR